MNILIVDDSQMMRGILRKALCTISEDIRFTDASDGIEALDAISSASRKGGFQLILIDWNMPNMDGIALVTKIRSTDKTTPLLMVTTEAEKSRILEAIKAGVTNYALKPFTPESLLEKVKLTLSRAA